VETADLNRQRSDYVGFLQLLPQLIQFFPALGQLIGGRPEAARSFLEQALRLFRFPDRQAILGNDTQQALVAAMQPQPMAPGVPGMPGQPGAQGMPGQPPTAPPPPGPPSPIAQ
jgi:hypothetical protein